MARLELLSNTAMLKNVLDKTKDGPSLQDENPVTRSLSPSMRESTSSERSEGACPTKRVALERADVHTTGNPAVSIINSSYNNRPTSMEANYYEVSYPGGVVSSQYHQHPPPRPSYFVNSHRVVSAPDNSSYHHYVEPYSAALRYGTKENVSPPTFHHCHLQHTDNSKQHYDPKAPTPAAGAPMMYAVMESTYCKPNPQLESLQRLCDELKMKNQYMSEQLQAKDVKISSLQHQVKHLEERITELRQLPTGKISHIPISDMVRIMQEYGSEVSNQTLPKRKDGIQKASIVRQFRRWNPEFFRYFVHVNGEWVPKLGKEGELKRRAEKRRMLKSQSKGH